jgi:hypothetical protein
MNRGFVIGEIRGFGPSICDMVEEGRVLRNADAASAAFARCRPQMFAFNVLIVARRADESDDIYEGTAASAAPAVHCSLRTDG